MPDRAFYFWNRRNSSRAELVRAADVSTTGRAHSPTTSKRLRDGILGIAIPALENEIEHREKATFRIVDDTDGLVGPARKPKLI